MASTIQQFNKCERAIKLDKEIGFYKAIKARRRYQDAIIKSLEKDVDIFINKQKGDDLNGI